MPCLEKVYREFIYILYNNFYSLNQVQILVIRYFLGTHREAHYKLYEKNVDGKFEFVFYSTCHFIFITHLTDAVSLIMKYKGITHNFLYYTPKLCLPTQQEFKKIHRYCHWFWQGGEDVPVIYIYIIHLLYQFSRTFFVEIAVLMIRKFHGQNESM